MAKKEFIEGTWSRQYEYVEICRDDNSCKKRFKWREEEDLAEEYYTHLQSLDDQANTYREQKRTADELEALRKATEEKNRRDKEQPFRPPFPQPTRQVLDPEYQEWLEFKKATDPEFLKWKQKKQEAQRKAEQERIRAEQERIKAEQERLKKEEEERKKREEEFERNAKASAVIQSVRIEHNVNMGNEFGMKILVDFHVNYMRNKQGEINAYFYLLKNDNFSKLMDCNKNYYSKDGQVCAGLKFAPTLPQQQYHNLALFIPYNELHLPKGKHNLNFNVEIFDNLNVSIARSKDYNFEMNMNKASLLGVHKQNKTPGKSCLKTLLILFFVVSIGCIIFMFGGIMLGL